MVIWTMLILSFLIILFLLNLLSTFSMVKKHYRGVNGIKFKIISNIRIAYTKSGSGTPLLLIHGFMASSYYFKGIIEDLSKKHTVYAVDVPGFGFSDKSPEVDYSRNGMAKIIYEFMRSEGVECFNLLGHSMGGEISLHMVINHPESINKLILVSSAGCQDIKVTPEFILSKPYLFNFFIRNIFMTYYFQKFCFEATIFNRKSYNRDIFDTIFVISKVNILPETLRRITRQADEYNVLPKLRFIKNETLIIWGEKDNVVPLNLANRINELIEDSKLQIMKSCKHNPHLEKPEEFLEMLNNFLNT